MLLAVNTTTCTFASSLCLPNVLPSLTFAASKKLDLRLQFPLVLDLAAPVIMIEAFIFLLLAQWSSTTNAQMVVTPPSCYYSPNQTLETVFFPCGDPQNGFKSCCQEGDTCLADNACFNPVRRYSLRPQPAIFGY